MRLYTRIRWGDRVLFVCLSKILRLPCCSTTHFTYEREWAKVCEQATEQPTKRTNERTKKKVTWDFCGFFPPSFRCRNVFILFRKLGLCYSNEMILLRRDTSCWNNLEPVFVSVLFRLRRMVELLRKVSLKCYDKHYQKVIPIQNVPRIWILDKKILNSMAHSQTNEAHFVRNELFNRVIGVCRLECDGINIHRFEPLESRCKFTANIYTHTHRTFFHSSLSHSLSKWLEL